jgi:hypothetical protein
MGLLRFLAQGKPTGHNVRILKRFPFNLAGFYCKKDKKTRGCF